MKINLLPWREAERLYQRQLFKKSLLGIGLLTLAIMLVIYLFSASRMSSSEAHQNLIKSEVKHINQQVNQLRKYQKIKVELTKQLIVLQNLNHNRYQVIMLFNKLPMLIPKDIFVNKIILKENVVQIFGQTTSNQSIGKILKRVNQMPEFYGPRLNETQTDTSQQPPLIRFEASFSIKTHQSKEPADAKN